MGAVNSTMVAKCQHIIGFLLASAATLRSSCCCCSLATASAAMSDNHHVCMIQLCWYWLRSEQRIGTSLVVGLNTISLVVLHEWHLLVLGQLVIMNEEDFAFSEQIWSVEWKGRGRKNRKWIPTFKIGIMATRLALQGNLQICLDILQCLAIVSGYIIGNTHTGSFCEHVTHE